MPSRVDDRRPINFLPKDHFRRESRIGREFLACRFPPITIAPERGRDSLGMIRQVIDFRVECGRHTVRVANRIRLRLCVENAYMYFRVWR